ncbi:MAG TPA: molybdenum ABC transporter ATP-binding protein [Pirellulales bacterium]|jgi:molybdate transport system ATP-binding protein|nr:molybdenum ABC transporter ATP-binding protein [Pirellulales bacterium]
MSCLDFDCRFQYPGGFQLAATFRSGDGVTALFGASGAGKTTIFRLIAGILRPAEGKICLAERVFVDIAAGQFLSAQRRQIGVVFQEQLLFPHLNVRNNLVFGSRHRISGQAEKFSLAKVVDLLDIGTLLERDPATLSGGQRQRVAIGRALLRGPQLLLMDEPLAGLDEGLKQRILSYLARIVAEWRIPVLFISHDQADVLQFAEQVIIVEEGRVVDAGPTARTLEQAVRSRLKHPPDPINLLHIGRVAAVDGRWQGSIGEQVVVLPPISGGYAAQSVCVQFLPRDVTLSTAEVPALSARNQLHGRVREIVPLAERTFVAIDIGQLIWAQVTAAAISDLGLTPGQPIVCLIKATALLPVG